MNLIVRLYSPPIRQQPAASSSSSSILLSLHAYMAAGIITIQHMLIYRLCRPLCIIIESTKYCITCSAWAGSGRVSACLALATVVAILTSLVLSIRYLLLLLLQGECMHVAVWSLIPCCRPKITARMCGRPWSSAEASSERSQRLRC